MDAVVMDAAVGATVAKPLAVRGLLKRYGQHQVLRGLDLDVEPGAVLGLVGLNGAGKTTALQCILGLLPYDAGDISVLGLPPHLLYRSQGQVAVVFDEPCLHSHLSVRQTLEHASLLCPGQKQPLEELEDLLGITRYRHFKISQLSLGNRRRTSIAQALVGQPALLVLDEPFNGLDAGGVDDLLALIRRLNRESGISFLLASHQLSYLERSCSHMAIVHQGQIARAGALDQLLASGRPRLLLHTDQPQRSADLLAGMDAVRLCSEQSRDGQLWAECELLEMNSAQVNAALVSAGVQVFALRPERSSLEGLFHQITGRSAREEMAPELIPS